MLSVKQYHVKFKTGLYQVPNWIQSKSLRHTIFLTPLIGRLQRRHRHRRTNRPMGNLGVESKREEEKGTALIKPKGRWEIGEGEVTIWNREGRWSVKWCKSNSNLVITWFNLKQILIYSFSDTKIRLCIITILNTLWSSYFNLYLALILLYLQLSILCLHLSF